MKKCNCCGYKNADWANLCKVCKSVLPRDFVLPVSTNKNSAEEEKTNTDSETPTRASKRKRSE